MGFNDWIRIDPAPMALDARLSEIDTEAKEKLASEIQTRIRGRVDPGIDLKSARRAQRVRAMEKGGSIVIDEHDQDAVLRGGMAPQRDISQARAGSVADLFTMGTGVPQVEEAPDGTRRMVFRTIDENQLFAAQEQKEQDRAVQETVTETLRMGIVDAVEEAAAAVERRYPEDKFK
jgi:hypothetical protein